MTLLNIFNSKEFLTAFWDNIDNKRNKNISERECQRILVETIRYCYPYIFVKHFSDLPSMQIGLGFDILLISNKESLFIEVKKDKKYKITESQKLFINEIKSYSFIKFIFLFIDTNKKIIRIKQEWK